VQRSDWVLLAVSAARGEALTPVQLQKSLFLLGTNMSQEVGDGYFAFQPYHYGPFSTQIYRDADELVDQGLLAIDTVEPGRPWRTYRATQQGLQRSEELQDEASSRAANYLASVVQWARRLTFQQLVSAIYERYPEQRVNSVFQS
jgi:hypothetical protein